jgi:hypothetical protein
MPIFIYVVRKPKNFGKDVSRETIAIKNNVKIGKLMRRDNTNVNKILVGNISNLSI